MIFDMSRSLCEGLRSFPLSTFKGIPVCEPVSLPKLGEERLTKGVIGSVSGIKIIETDTLPYTSRKFIKPKSNKKRILKKCRKNDKHYKETTVSCIAYGGSILIAKHLYKGLNESN